MHIINADSIQPVPWRNGGGLTRELLTWPGKQTDWSIRITLAAIDRSGPSSHFADIDRWFALARGTRLEMTFPDDQLVLNSDSAALCFDGAQAPDCDLPDGPVSAFNFMVSRRHGRGNMERVRPGAPWQSEARWRAVFTMEPASLTVAGQEPKVLGHGTLLWTDTATDTPWTLTTTEATPRAWWVAFHTVNHEA